MSKQCGGGFSTNGSGAGSAGNQYGFDPIRGAPLSAAFKVRSKRTYRQRGAGLGDGTGAGAGAGSGSPSGFNAIHAGSSVSGIVLSDAATRQIIPLGVTEQGMGFQKMTSSFHRSRKQRSRKQRGGALAPAPYSTLGETLPSSMTGPMTTTGLGGSATGVLDGMLVQTRGPVQQSGGGSRRKHRKTKGKKQSLKQNYRNRQQQQRNRQQQQQNRNRQQQQQRNRNRQQQQTRRPQRGGSPLGFGPAAGPSVILSPQELTKAGLNPQWFDENQVNPNFGGALTVPGGR